MIETPAEILAHWAGAEAAHSFAAYRKARKAPLTTTAALRIAKTLRAIVARGGDAADALGMAEEHNWQTVKEDWYFGQITRDGGPCNRPDPALEQIARLTGLTVTPGGNRH